MQEVEALVVGEKGVGAVVQEQVHDVVVAAFGGPEHGGCDGISAFCIYGGAGLDQEMAEGVVVVDCCPLFRQLAHYFYCILANLICMTDVHVAVLCPARPCM